MAIQTLLSIVAATDSDLLLRHLPAVEQEVYRSRTRLSSCDQPQFYWIFKNMDFDRWQSASGSEVLWLSGPAECRISDASSHIVDLVKGKYPEAQHSVLYFFCYAAPSRIPIAITFVSTVVCQLIRCSPKLKQEITTIFLYTLLHTILEEEKFSQSEVSRFNADDSVELIVKKILKVPSEAYWGALKAVADVEREKGLSIIIDGLDRSEHEKYQFIRELCVFIENLQGGHSTTRVLLTSRPQAEIKEIVGLFALPCSFRSPFVDSTCSLYGRPVRAAIQLLLVN